MLLFVLITHQSHAGHVFNHNSQPALKLVVWQQAAIMTPVWLKADLVAQALTLMLKQESWAVGWLPRPLTLAKELSQYAGNPHQVVRQPVLLTCLAIS